MKFKFTILCLAIRLSAFAQTPVAKMEVNAAGQAVVFLEWPANASATNVQISTITKIGVFYSEPAGTPTLGSLNGDWQPTSTSFTRSELEGFAANPDSLAYIEYELTNTPELGDATTAGTRDTLFTLTFSNPRLGRVVRLLQSTSAGVGIGTYDAPIVSFGSVPVIRYRPNGDIPSSPYTSADMEQSSTTLPLPVELLAFTASQADQHTAMLRWTTASEINNSRFDIERSYDGRTFEVVGDVAGNGNSQHQIDYSYTDASVSKVQKTVYYRLKQVDFDGAFEYSDIRVVRFDALGNDMQLAAFPNPLNNELNVMVGLSNGESYQLEVTNLQGALIHQENHTYDNGIHKLNTSEWNSGMYIVEVVSDRGSEHIKVMKK